MRTVYLDNNATTEVYEEVLDAMLPYFRKKFGNPSTKYGYGKEARRAVEEARDKVAELIDCAPHEIAFTSGGSESNNEALVGAVRAAGDGSRVLMSRIEHSSMTECMKRLTCERHEWRVIGVDGKGRMNLEDIRKGVYGTGGIMRCVVSAMWANNETGNINPISEIEKIAHEFNALVVTDAVQAVGKVPIDVKEVQVDVLTASGHKFHAPKGIGFIYVRNGVELPSLILGGRQEHGLRAGTENVPSIVGLGKACEIAKRELAEGTAEMARLRDRLQDGILRMCDTANVNGDAENRLANTLNVSFMKYSGEKMMYRLAERGVCVTTGSACSLGGIKPSHVLTEMKVGKAAASGGIRFSLSRSTTEEDIDHAIWAVKDSLEEMKRG